MTSTDLREFLSTCPRGVQVEWMHEGRRLRATMQSAQVTDGDVVILELGRIAEASGTSWRRHSGAAGTLTLITLGDLVVQRDTEFPDRFVFNDVTGPIYFDLPGTSHFVVSRETS